MRNKEAMDVALAGLEHGLAYLDRNRPKINSTSGTAPVGWMQPGNVRWTACGGGTTTLPCGDGVSSNIYGPINPQVGGRDGNWLAYTSVGDVNAVQFPVSTGSKYTYSVSYLTPGFGPAGALAPDENPLIIIVSTATPTPDATTGAIDPLAGSATARMTVRGYSTLVNIPAAPLMAAGTVTPTGSVAIWGNPTGRLMPPLLPATLNPASVVTTVTGSTPPPSSSSMTTATMTNGGVPLTTVSNATPNPGGSPGASTPTDGWGGGSDGPYTAINTVTSTVGTTTTTQTTRGTPLSAWVGSTTPLFSSSSPSSCRNLPVAFPLPSNACDGFEYSFERGGTILRPGDPLRRDFLNGNRISAYLASGAICWEPFPGEPLAAPNPVGCPAIVTTDLFSYVFGVPDAKFQTIKNEFTPIGCSSLSGQPAGRYWTGGCILTGVTVGSQAEPVILVVESGDLTITGGVFFGLIYVRDPAGTHDIAIGGGATLYGALVSDRDIDSIMGGANFIYDDNVLRRSASSSGGGFSKLTGGWRDQLQP